MTGNTVLFQDFKHMDAYRRLGHPLTSERCKKAWLAYLQGHGLVGLALTNPIFITHSSSGHSRPDSERPNVQLESRSDNFKVKSDHSS